MKTRRSCCWMRTTTTRPGRPRGQHPRKRHLPFVQAGLYASSLMLRQGSRTTETQDAKTSVRLAVTHSRWCDQRCPLAVLVHAAQCPKTVDNFKCLCTGEKGLGKASKKPLHYQVHVEYKEHSRWLLQRVVFSGLLESCWHPCCRHSGCALPPHCQRLLLPRW